MKARIIAVAVAVLVFVPAAYSAGKTTHSAKKAKTQTTIVIYASGDVNVQNLWQNNIIPHFEKENPGIYVKFVFSPHGADDGTTLARIGAAVKGRHWPGIDLVDAGLVTTLALDGLDQPVSKATAPNIKKVNPALLTPVKGAAIPYRGSSVVLAYNSNYVKTPPKTLADLLAWIKANPGKFTYNSPNTGGSGYSFAETVVDSFISAADLKQMDNGYVPNLESDWNQGLQALHGLTKYVYQGVYPNGNAATLQLLAQGQIWIAPVWSDQSLSALASGQLGPNIKLTQISSPSFTGGAAYLGVPKTARHKKVLYRFVNYILSPEAQQMIVNVMSGFPAIDIKYMGSAIQQKFEDVSANTLRPTFSTKMGNDFKAQWQQTVP
ncbi:MAG: extracellular solute-binding protein [Acidobacteriota bacterium]|nr:extracellular solute-binding protein [Acidobacteriota bacterium]